ncbi:hypothetical protein GCM10007424_11470 [Flavobacterium suaedae]|uniref:VWA domain-containing protein n=1 Tax=Flavobacterium suaedae TaxID=1767027 RepID=A0ABQ1JP59_9FLAO|nr:hypothetical protein [Flavobacterium suaedae]GGB73278.1 hypothetical protein GCM10007424_11470 [Flavobacterium suaedae]
MKFTLFKILILLVISASPSCKSDNETNYEIEENIGEQEKVKSDDKLNISFLLDLSDRIDPEEHPNESMEYYLRDVAYIQSVAKVFTSSLKTKKTRLMDDDIQLYFDPAPKNKDINRLSDELKFNVNSKNATLKLLNKIDIFYSKKPLEIYKAAIKDKDYIGSDTWRFFETNIKDYCIRENHRNILVILTDGYIYHENSKITQGNKTSYLTSKLIKRLKLNDEQWKAKIENKGYGFITANNNLSDIEILVLGINPDDGNPYEESVIKYYWEHWFNNMKVKKYKIVTTALPSNTNQIIKDFITND